MRKLSDAEVATIRSQAAESRSTSEIAAEFGISAQYASAIIRRRARQQLGGLDEDTVRGADVSTAVERFLADLPLTAAEQVLAAAARQLARKLDQAAESETIGSAAAAPSIARELGEVVERLRGDEHIPDVIDQLKAQRDARRLAMFAGQRDEKA